MASFFIIYYSPGVCLFLTALIVEGVSFRVADLARYLTFQRIISEFNDCQVPRNKRIYFQNCNFPIKKIKWLKYKSWIRLPLILCQGIWITQNQFLYSIYVGACGKSAAQQYYSYIQNFKRCFICNAATDFATRRQVVAALQLKSLNLVTALH